ncbi:MAG: ThiF family adenylyltransferase, partial [Chitinispirillaceae bacterium]|nr:ThiF family adenylyltransferase [Chitinispirillaceae bacterium]
EPSNLNRQHYFQNDIGAVKVEALACHLTAINPAVRLTLVNRKIAGSDVPAVFGDADLLIEAFDRAEAKSWLIEAWCAAFPHKPVVCASGIAGIGNTGALTIRRAGMVHVVGDGKSDMGMGLCSARVAIAANMQANIALEQLTNDRSGRIGTCQ